MKNLENQTISLAAIYQSCYIIKEISWHGNFKKDELEILIDSIFITNPSSIYDVYNNVEKLKTGMKLLKEQLAGFDINREIKGYFSSLLNLSKALEKNVVMTTKIQDELLQLKNLFFDKQITFDEKSIRIASLYSNTLSKIEPRIIITGNNKYLKDTMFASKIRTSLFAGLRSIFLWKQYGGSRIKIFFYKSKIINEIDRLLAF
ncbi:MAG: DUF489 family protein [Pseudomonadota bacterium]|nr:DUF489 family protein [Pseudomonadota bacterium]